MLVLPGPFVRVIDYVRLPRAGKQNPPALLHARPGPVKRRGQAAPRLAPALIRNHPSSGGQSMFRRLVAGLLVVGIAVALSAPAVGQDKEKDKDKKPTTGPVELKWKLEKDKVFY